MLKVIFVSFLLVLMSPSCVAKQGHSSTKLVPANVKSVQKNVTEDVNPNEVVTVSRAQIMAIQEQYIAMKNEVEQARQEISALHGATQCRYYSISNNLKDLIDNGN